MDVKWLLQISGALTAAAAGAIAVFFLWATSGVYPTDRYTEIRSFDDGTDNGVEDGATAADPLSNLGGTTNTLTVVTYNIGYLSGLTNNQAVQRNRTLLDANQQTAIAALDAVDADFIAFQEIDFDAKRSFFADQVAAIAQGLGFSQGAIAVNWNKRYVPFPYWPPATHFGQIVSGQAVLSRYPITENERVVLQRLASKPFYYKALYLDRLAQVTQVDVDGQPLVLINVHLEAFDEPTRRQQTATVLELYNQYATDYPVILLGDFNSSIPNSEETDPTINQLLQADGIAVATSPADFANQLTFPSDTPTVKLDYIFYDPEDIEPLNASVMTNAAQASDHLPVRMDFRLRD